MIRLWCVALVAVVAVVSCDSVPLTSPSGSTISISIDRSVLPLNGQATVRAVVIESSGTPVHNGTTVNFTASIGSVIPATAETVNGVATATFMAGTVSGVGAIHAFSGGIRTGSGNSSSGGVEVTIGAAAAGAMAVSATPSSVSQGGGTVTVTALVMDAANNPLPGVSVLFSTSTGSLNSTTGLSDGNGIARVQLTTSQTATVTAIAGSAKGEVQVVVSRAPVVTLTVPDTGFAGVPVAMSVAPPTASETTVPRQIQRVVIDFGDGQSQTFTNITGSIGFTHTYSGPGGFTVTATATDVDGNTSITSDAIVISRAVPLVSVSANPNSGTAPFNSTITTTASTTGPALESVQTFVNGTLVHSSSAAGSFAHRFAAAGTYTILTIARDTAGNESRATTIVVAN